MFLYHGFVAQNPLNWAPEYRRRSSHDDPARGFIRALSADLSSVSFSLHAFPFANAKSTQAKAYATTAFQSGSGPPTLSLSGRGRFRSPVSSVPTRPPAKSV